MTVQPAATFVSGNIAELRSTLSRQALTGDVADVNIMSRETEIDKLITDAFVGTLGIASVPSVEEGDDAFAKILTVAAGEVGENAEESSVSVGAVFQIIGEVGEADEVSEDVSIFVVGFVLAEILDVGIVLIVLQIVVSVVLLGTLFWVCVCVLVEGSVSDVSSVGIGLYGCATECDAEVMSVVGLCLICGVPGQDALGA